jgi:hypothetical protein
MIRFGIAADPAGFELKVNLTTTLKAVVMFSPLLKPGDRS